LDDAPRPLFSTGKIVAYCTPFINRHINPIRHLALPEAGLPFVLTAASFVLVTITIILSFRPTCADSSASYEPRSPPVLTS
jgi:hypothetical protein